MKSENDLNKVVTLCGKAVDERQQYLSQLYEHRLVQKARMILDDNSNVLAKCYEICPSGR